MLLSLATSAVLILLALTIAAHPCTAAPVAMASGPELRAAMEREIPRLLREAEVPGISIAVIRDKKIAWSGAFGVADPASGTPVRPDTVFQAASLTKPVVAYVTLRLADRGAIDLDRPLWATLPHPRLEKDPRARRITARHVLSHTTGLPNWGDDKLETRFPPGERFGYSGEGFVWLQKTLEKLTGTPIADLVRQEAFAPLGMAHSSLVWEEGFLGTAAIAPSGAVEPQPQRREANAAASLVTTAEDYGRFLVAILEGTGLKPETRTALLTPVLQVSSRYSDPASPPHEGLAWGLGVGLQGPGGREAFWHWGDNGAWRAYVFVRTDGSAGLIYFANSHEGLSIARALASIAVGGPQTGLDWLGYESHDDPRHVARKDIEKALRSSPEAGARRWRELRKTQPAVINEELALEMAENLIDWRRGVDAVAILEAAAAEDPRSAKLQDRLGIASLTAGDLEKARRSFEKALKLDPKTPSRQAELRWIDEGLEARKKPVSLSEEELRRFIGDYGPRHVTLENGRLVYRRDGLPQSWPLVPLSSDTFAPEGLGDIRIRFAADPGGRVTKLVILGPGGVEGESAREGA
jgi:CubicO group peptidase (beta-lactamase class C family)